MIETVLEEARFNKLEIGIKASNIAKIILKRSKLATKVLRIRRQYEPNHLRSQFPVENLGRNI